ncbi:hypothetical protein KAU04_04950 [bacterium]|nr:hypothetical protein [bacterium]MCK4597362.1 hypothetical protein [bacterium]
MSELISGKRGFWATVLGIISGILCYLLGRGSIPYYPTWMVIVTILNRALIGFCIGTSSLRLPWAVHGIFWGLLISLMMAIPAWGQGSSQDFFLLMIAGAIWGFFIELFTSKVFKAPAVKTGSA